MNVTLSTYMTGFLLTPRSLKLRKQQRLCTGEDSALFQPDWDFPPLARALGWNMSGEGIDSKCDHVGTDGTIDCPECDTPAEHLSLPPVTGSPIETAVCFEEILSPILRGCDRCRYEYTKENDNGLRHTWNDREAG